MRGDNKRVFSDKMRKVTYVCRCSDGGTRVKTKVLAIYLPQFHEIPENDEWWGKGFTEWTNVKRGKPFYYGHYQPREPLNDDYYDLSDSAVLEKHIKLARKAGIYGFAFYHYYFSGKKLLEMPIEKYRDFSKECFPYCLIWANQSWARTWYRTGLGKSVLLEQSYGNEEAWKEQFNYLLTFFKDKRYIKIENKPVYIIYIPQEIDCRRKMFSYWNKLAKVNGFNGIYFVAMKTSFGEDSLVRLYDAYMDFEPLNYFTIDHSFRKRIYRFKANHISYMVKNRKSIINWLFARNIYSYSHICRVIEKRGKQQKKKTFICTFPDWDNTSRKDEEGTFVRGSSPKKFGRHMDNVLRLSGKMKNEFVFINAWNEWSEGAYLQPDKKYGYAYLNSLKNAILSVEQETED